MSHTAMLERPGEVVRTTGWIEVVSERRSRLRLLDEPVDYYFDDREVGARVSTFTRYEGD